MGREICPAAAFRIETLEAEFVFGYASERLGTARELGNACRDGQFAPIPTEDVEDRPLAY